MKQVKIRVVKVPDGGTALEVRQEWVGVEFFAIAFDGIIKSLDVVTGEKRKNKGGWIVDIDSAISALVDSGKNPIALKWWQKWRGENIGLYMLIFKKEECVKI